MPYVLVFWFLGAMVPDEVPTVTTLVVTALNAVTT